MNEDDVRKANREYRDKVFKYEAHLEEYLCRKVKEAGGLPIKFTSLTMTGLPDRIIFYNGFTWLVELKMPKGSVQPNQAVCHKLFARHGFKTWIVRTKEDVEKFIDSMRNIEI